MTVLDVARARADEPQAPRDNLTRSVPFELDRADEGGDGLTLSGYAAVFNARTTIDSWEGQFEEQIAPGAFKRSINAGKPVLQFDHGRHPLVGSIPLGNIKTLREDQRGLYVEARLHDNWLVEPVRDAIASGAVDGMSFRFSVVRDSWEHPKSGSKKLPVRTLEEVKLHELGPVVFPAYRQTTVGVRSEVVTLLDEIMRDDDLRADLARALVLGTRIDGSSSDDDTRERPASPDEDDSRPATAGTRRTVNQRRGLAFLADVA